MTSDAELMAIVNDLIDNGKLLTTETIIDHIMTVRHSYGEDLYPPVPDDVYGDPHCYAAMGARLALDRLLTRIKKGPS